MERTVRELQGTPCIDLEHNPSPKKEIATTRSFGRPVLELHQLAEAVTDFASRAAEKLRKQSGMANQVLVYIRTSPFRPDPQYSRSITTPLRRPSADTACIAKAALDGLQRIFKYAKAGVMLLDLQHEGQQQCELDLEGDSQKDRSTLMTTLDGLNQRYGKGTLHMASAGVEGNKRLWSMKQERRTPRYTTSWDDLPVAKA